MSIQEIVEIEVKNNTSKIITPLPYSVKDEISSELAFQPANIEWSPKVKVGIKVINKDTGLEEIKKWDGFIRLFKKQNSSFPTGFVPRVRNKLEQLGYSVRFIDARIVPDKSARRPWKFAGKFFRNNAKIDLRNYQEEAIDQCIKCSRGLVSHPTGTGKTVTISGLIAKLAIAPVLVFVPTKDLLYQTQDEISNMIDDGTGHPLHVGVIGDGKVDLQDVTVCIIDSALSAYGIRYNPSTYKVEDDKRKRIPEEEKKSISAVQQHKTEIQDLIRTANVIIADECHRCAAPMWEAILEKNTHASYRFGASATPFRDDGCELKIEGMFARIVHEKTLRECIYREPGDEDWLMDPYIRMIRTDYDPDGAYLKEEKDYKAREAEPDRIWVPATDWDYQTTYQELIVYNRHFNTRVANIASKFIEKNMSCLILVREKEQGRMIRDIIGEDRALFLSSENTTKVRLQTKSDLKDKSLMCLIATSIADMGLNMPSLDVLILAGGGGSEKNKKKVKTVRGFKTKKPQYDEEDDSDADAEEVARFGAIIRQRIGRVLRKSPGKEWAVVIDFWHKQEMMRRQSKARKKIYKMEQLNFKIIDEEELDFSIFYPEGHNVEEMD